jgi:hypothetical protein
MPEDLVWRGNKRTSSTFPWLGSASHSGPKSAQLRDAWIVRLTHTGFRYALVISLADLIQVRAFKD